MSSLQKANIPPFFIPRQGRRSFLQLYWSTSHQPRVWLPAQGPLDRGERAEGLKSQCWGATVVIPSFRKHQNKLSKTQPYPVLDSRHSIQNLQCVTAALSPLHSTIPHAQLLEQAESLETDVLWADKVSNSSDTVSRDNIKMISRFTFTLQPILQLQISSQLTPHAVAGGLRKVLHILFHTPSLDQPQQIPDPLDGYGRLP